VDNEFSIGDESLTIEEKRKGKKKKKGKKKGKKKKGANGESFYESSVMYDQNDNPLMTDTIEEKVEEEDSHPDLLNIKAEDEEEFIEPPNEYIIIVEEQNGEIKEKEEEESLDIELDNVERESQK
jgi:hypothetical protein